MKLSSLLIVLSVTTFAFRIQSKDAHVTHKATKDSAHGKKAHWAYEGEEGPSAWGKLEGFELCEHGKEQSPIDLRWKKPSNKRKIEFHYASDANGKILDNGHTIQVNLDAGNYALIEGKRFELVQFHFHSHSEHALSKKFFPLEMHFVHKDSEGKLAVVGVLFEEGKENSEIKKLWSELPSEKEKEVQIQHAKLNLNALLPTQLTHYHYQGSLTTPPCTEGVSWNVLNTPIKVSKEQLQNFTHLYSNNFRPLQNVNERKPANY
jgi:carbonic anhydrase